MSRAGEPQRVSEAGNAVFGPGNTKVGPIVKSGPTFVN